MKRLLLPVLLLAGCGGGAQQDLPSIGEARSLAAEWAMINDLAAHVRINATYAHAMRAQLREQLKSAAATLTQPDSRYGEEIQTLLAEPDDASPQELRAHSERLKQIEDSLESA